MIYWVEKGFHFSGYCLQRIRAPNLSTKYYGDVASSERNGELQLDALQRIHDMDGELSCAEGIASCRCRKDRKGSDSYTLCPSSCVHFPKRALYI